MADVPPRHNLGRSKDTIAWLDILALFSRKTALFRNLFESNRLLIVSENFLKWMLEDLRIISDFPVWNQ